MTWPTVSYVDGRAVFVSTSDGNGSGLTTVLLGTGSGELLADTCAWFSICNVPTGGVPTVTVKLTVTVAPPGTSPRLNVTTPADSLQVPAGFVHVPNVVPTGTGSVTTVSCAVTFDSLLTTSVYVIVLPFTT